MDTKSHYKDHLSKIYSWMFGNFDEMVQLQKNFFEKNSILPQASRVAIDLGAGSGFQSIALTELGFKVYAVDFSMELLAELKNKNGSIETILGDIRDLTFASRLKPELIVCMGDTLTHLDSKTEVKNFINQISRLLSKNGQLIFTFRDLSEPKLELDRFIPVKSDDNRILTCFLEDEGEKVKVNDLLWERTNGQWHFTKSFYKKIKLNALELKKEMELFSLAVSLMKLPSGLDVLIGKKL